MIEQIIEQEKAQNVVVLSVGHLTAVTDFLVICSGSSSRHMRHLADSAVNALRAAELEVLHTEGLDSDDWMIVDAGDVVLHVMSTQARDFYQLERLWDIAELED